MTRETRQPEEVLSFEAAMERLEQLAETPLQRIALSATQRLLEEVARFVVGPRRECTILDTGMRKPLDLEILVPVEDMTEPDSEIDLNEVARILAEA